MVDRPMTHIGGSFDQNEESVKLHGARGIVAGKVQQRLSACPYSYCFNRVKWRYAHGTLTLEGSVATFYLKQLLQTLLRGVENVERIANDVDVVSSTGLSSERPTHPRQFGVPS
jgi:hypothetical protein